MKTKLEHSFQLTPKQLAFLEQMAREHDLPDASKALRCLVAYAMSVPAREDEIFDVVRCASPDECPQAGDAPEPRT